MTTLPTQFIALLGILYVCLLFVIAHYGDKQNSNGFFARNRALVYSLSLAVYCSSWTFFGAVGSAARDGWEFFAIYLGPILMFVFGHKMLKRIIIISKQYSITSVSDFLSSRYGKSRNVAVLVTFIAVIGSLPYISLQLHAISTGFATLTTQPNTAEGYRASISIWSDTAFYSALMLAVFSILFGTRKLNATEHHRGMIHAIAFESIIKLVAILFVGLYATQLLFSQFEWQQIVRQPFELTTFGEENTRFSWSGFFTKLILSMSAIILLPRQFQTTVVESEDHQHINTARWLFPLYLLLISLVGVPIAIAGLVFLPSSANADFYVINLPQLNNNFSLAMIAFIGGISAATGMVIVASISLSTMVCNDVVMPFLIRSKLIDIKKRPDLSQIILAIRRLSILAILLSSYGYFRLSGNNLQLANMGLLSFAAIIQFAPAMVAALYWRRANQNGVQLGLILGFMVWAYCLLIPNFIEIETLNNIFSNLSWLHPHHLFNFKFNSSLTHGVTWSLLVNISALVIGSLRYTPTMLDKIQASIFSHTQVDSSDIAQIAKLETNATIENAKILCESIIGLTSTELLFDQYERKQGNISQPMMEDIERAIAGVIGASSARHIITTQLLGDDVSAEDIFVMMDETTQALQFNQDILQASFENISQGISVVDKDLKLVAWNSRYQAMFDYPEALLKIGTPVEKLIRYNAERGDCGSGDVSMHIKRRLDHLINSTRYSSERMRRGAYIKINGNPIPGGGFVTSFTDITEQKDVEQALRSSESRIRLYTDSLPLMLCYIGQDKKVHFSNKAYNQFVGKSRELIHLSSVHDVFKGKEFAERKNHIKDALSGTACEFNCSEPDENGQAKHYQINYIPQIDTNNKVSGFFAIYQDISHSVQASHLLKKTNEKLEERVVERTHDLEQLNNQLQDENTRTTELSEQLKAVTKSKTRFLAAASHDLLQPINAARLFTNSLIDQPNSPAFVDGSLLHKIDSSLVSADKLLRALLDISKLDTGSLSPDIRPFQLSELTLALETELTPLAENKGLTLRFVHCTAIVSSDINLLRSIIQNLITNAIRYTKTGTVLVGCRRKAKTLTIDVIDTGTGISEKDLPTIFNEFHRLKNPADHEKQGLGLGLAITKRLAEILEHPLKVNSSLDKGSQFSISITRYSGKVVNLPKKKQWQPASNLDNITVLYLENVPESLEAMQALLNSWGCHVIPCVNFDQAKDTFKNSTQNIDLVLADYRLDNAETGLDFLDFACEHNAEITCVLVTAEQDLSIKNIALEKGYTFLAKPVEPAALRGILTRMATGLR